MNGKLLVAIDLSENSLKAVDYVGYMMSCHKEVLVTLLHVIREPSPDTMPDEKDRKRFIEKTRSEVLALMEEAGRRLGGFGIPEKCVVLKVHTCGKPVSVADLILHEQRTCGHGTVVVGRRGVSKREEFLFGSVSNSVMREAKDCAVWVVE
ncbi:MAG: universal stress protein [Acidobacteriota bacterium]